MSIIEQLASQQVWEEFLAYRLKKGRFNWRGFDEADLFVEREEYLPVAQKIIDGGKFAPPRKKLINKMGTGKKRVVYSYGDDEMSILKVLSFLLYKYDESFASNCYAFRRGLRASDAVLKVRKLVAGRRLWAYKTDIHDYFNSIPIPLLLPKLKFLLSDDPALYEFFERMLFDDRIEYNGEIIHEQHGVMAGLPTAPFLADVYLSDVDHYFENLGVIYARYSDDIIIFAEDEATLLTYKNRLCAFLEESGLIVNPSKERVFTPDEPYEFLGFSCGEETIDIGPSSIEKMKGKIRRKMRALLRWKKRKGISSEKAMERMITYFNRKFYDCDPESEGRTLTWARWYFPVITTADGLRVIDHYLQQCIRTLQTGRHNSTTARIPYETLKNLGYRSLVHEYYTFKDER